MSSSLHVLGQGKNKGSMEFNLKNSSAVFWTAVRVKRRDTDMDCVFQKGNLSALVPSHYLCVLWNSRERSNRSRTCISPSKISLSLFMCFSVFNFLARLRKFLLRFHPKYPFSRLSLGRDIGTNSRLIVLFGICREKLCLIFPSIATSQF